MDNSPLSPEDLAFVRDCIARNNWTFAKTMPKIPHFYIVRNRCTLTGEEFDRFVRLQREFGTPMRWGKYNFPYLIIDGWKYWTMGAPIEETIIINRAEIKE